MRYNFTSKRPRSNKPRTTKVWFNEKKCDKCGKVFIAAPEHIYRDEGKSKWWCSWSFYNHKDDK